MFYDCHWSVLKQPKRCFEVQRIWKFILINEKLTIISLVVLKTIPILFVPNTRGGKTCSNIFEKLCGIMYNLVLNRLKNKTLQARHPKWLPIVLTEPSLPWHGCSRDVAASSSSRNHDSALRQGLRRWRIQAQERRSDPHPGHRHSHGSEILSGSGDIRSAKF